LLFVEPLRCFRRTETFFQVPNNPIADHWLLSKII
jgi:hypothetical protein